MEKLYKGIINFLDNNKDMDVPYLITGDRVYTKNDLIKELETNSDIGQLLVNDMVKLAIDLVARAKEKTKNFESGKK